MSGLWRDDRRSGRAESSCRHGPWEELRAHAYTAHGKKLPHACDECDYSTIVKNCLTRHVDGVHKNLRPFDCTECNFKASIKCNLLSHMNKIHKKTPFPCSQCAFRAAKKEDLTKHFNVMHRDPKPHVCSICHDFGANFESNLKNHIFRVHKKKRSHTRVPAASCTHEQTVSPTLDQTVSPTLDQTVSPALGNN